MDVRNLRPDKLPPHPNGTGGQGVWPLDPDTQAPLLRFHWEKPGSHNMNIEGLERIQATVRTQGPRLFPTCAAVLQNVFDEHLEARIAKKYRYLHLEWLKLHKARGHEGRDEDPFAAEDEAEGEGGAVREEKAMPCNTHNSRVASVRDWFVCCFDVLLTI